MEKFERPEQIAKSLLKVFKEDGSGWIKHMSHGIRHPDGSVTTGFSTESNCHCITGAMMIMNLPAGRTVFSDIYAGATYSAVADFAFLMAKKAAFYGINAPQYLRDGTMSLSLLMFLNDNTLMTWEIMESMLKAIADG